MHFYYRSIQIEGEMGQTEQSNTDTLRPNHNKKNGINMYSIFIYKKLFYTQV